MIEFISYGFKNRDDEHARIVFVESGTTVLLHDGSITYHPEYNSPEMYLISKAWDEKGVDLLWSEYVKKVKVQEYIAKQFTGQFACNNKMFTTKDNILVRNNVSRNKLFDPVNLTKEDLTDILTLGKDPFPFSSLTEYHFYQISIVENILSTAVNGYEYIIPKSSDDFISKLSMPALIKTLSDFKRYCRMRGIDICMLDDDVIENTILRRLEVF